MKTADRTWHDRVGSAMITVIVITSVISFATIGIIRLSTYHNRKQKIRTDLLHAFYTAENALLEGIQIISDEQYDPDNTIGEYSWGSETDPLTLPYSPEAGIRQAAVKIEADPMGVDHNYQVTSIAQAGEKKRAIQALVRWRPPSLVFDYEYFLNNWGWWWGSSITGYGDNRANWDFDFRYNPYVYGHIFANGDVESNMVPINPFTGQPPFRGIAGTNPLTYVHVGAPRLRMPNLKDIAYYESIAEGTITQGGNTLINAVHGDNEPKTGIYLEGTLANPITITGKVVVRGDMIIKGYVTGQGVFYVGGNMYVAGDLKYANGPNFATPPENMNPADRDAWVDANMSQDLVAFAVREAILVGKVNDGTWKSRCFDNSSYGLKLLNAEANLGADGIRGTPDDGINYLDTNGDGTPDSAWYDADEDGVVDVSYNYTNDIKLTDTRRGNITNYPTNSYGQPLDYNTVATDQATKWEGLFYTNHAIALNTNRGPNFMNGALICRDEAIVFSSALTFKYDSRIHSRYQRKYFAGDPNRIIDLGLPVTEEIRILDRYEIAYTEF